MAFWNRKKKDQEPEKDEKVEVASTIDQTSEPAPAEPKPEPKRRRSEILKLRLTPEELAYLTEQAAAAGMSRTDYIMASTKGSPVIVIDDVPQLLMELRRQGSNLNQMVRLAHQSHSVNLPGLQDALQRCVEVQAEVVQMCDRWDMMLRKKGE